MMAGSVELPPGPRGVMSAVLFGVTGSGWAGERYGLWSDDIEERGEAMLRSDVSEVVENSRLSRSRTLKDDRAAPGGIEC